MNIFHNILESPSFCIYDLQRLQDECKKVDNDIVAFEIDFFRADSFVNCSNEEIIQLTLQAIASTLHFMKPLDRTIRIDTSSVRARNAVSHFYVNSAKCINVDGVKIRRGIYACGDWIDRPGHSSWSTEKAVVTGCQVAMNILNDYNLPMKLKIE